MKYHLRLFFLPLCKSLLAALLLAGLSTTPLNAVTISTSTTYDGTSAPPNNVLVVSPAGTLTINGSSNPLLTLTNGATTSGVTQVVVGSTRKGSLLIEGGSVLTNAGGASLGTSVSTNSIGTVTVTGAGSTWSNVNSLSIGSQFLSTGTMNILNGGSVISSEGYVGDRGHGIVALSGAGSSWDVNGTGQSALSYTVNPGANPLAVTTRHDLGLTIGYVNAGTMSIADGASIYVDGGAYVAEQPGTTGTVSVSGPGATWTVAADGAYSVQRSDGALGTHYSGLSVGEAGTGTMTIDSGGIVNSYNGTIGYMTGATGNVTVDGVGSAWHINTAGSNSGNLVVGDTMMGGKGTLTVSNGGAVTADRSVTVDGSQSTLNVQSGGRLSTPSINVGNSGTVNVQNDGSLLATSVGVSDTLSIDSSGDVNSHNGTIGYSDHSAGSVTVDGAGSAWNITAVDSDSGNLAVGNSTTFGRGTLTIRNGGAVTADRSVTVDGYQSTLNVQSGGRLSTPSIIVVNSGALNVQSGATLTSANTTIRSNATITGAGTTWDNSGVSEAVGGLFVLNGARATSGGARIDSIPGASGYATISGGSSSWAVVGDIDIWTSDAPSYGSTTGYPSINITTGSTVSSTNAIFGGDASGSYVNQSYPSAEVSNGASWAIRDSLVLGTVSGTGRGIIDAEMDIDSGGSVSSSTAYIGSGSSTHAYDPVEGDLSVFGSGTRWSNSGDVYLGGTPAGGNGAIGTLYVDNQAQVTIGGALNVWRGQVEVGSSYYGNTGTLNAAAINVQGSQSWIINSSIINGPVHVHDAAQGGGIGGHYSQLVVDSGGTCSPGEYVHSTFNTANPIYYYSNSTGAVTSAITTWGTGGAYLWDINSLTGDAGMASGWDLWNVGDLTISGPFTISLFASGTRYSNSLTPYALAGWDPNQGYSWRIATATNHAFTSLTNLLLDPTYLALGNTFAPGSHLWLSSADNGNSLMLNYAPVPEPGTLLLATLTVR